MATRQDIRINQGETWSYTFPWSANLSSGYSAAMSIKKVPGQTTTALAYLSTGSDADGGTLALGNPFRKAAGQFLQVIAQTQPQAEHAAFRIRGEAFHQGSVFGHRVHGAGQAHQAAARRMAEAVQSFGAKFQRSHLTARRRHPASLKAQIRQPGPVAETGGRAHKADINGWQ